MQENLNRKIMRGIQKALLAIIGCGGVLFIGRGVAEVTLPPAISSHMVLQREMAIPIWGKAAPAEEVTVTFNGQTVKATADAEGKWLVKLASMPAGGPFPMSIAGKNTISLEDVLIGEVWLCSGQSNMAFFMKNVTDAAQELPQAQDPQLRLFNSKRTIADSPQFKVEGKWEECTPKSVESFSAVSYFFGKKLRQDLKVPVGLLHSSWGGTAAEVWVPKPMLEGDPDFKKILEKWAEDVAAYPEAMKAFQPKLDEFQKQVAAAKAAGQKPPKEPKGPRGEQGSRDTPTGGYYGMITPHQPFGIRGVIWYQGESDAKEAKRYQKLFPALIQSWRTAWGQGDFPFLFVQLPNILKKNWPELREAQLLTLKASPNTAMAVTIDLGDPNDLHPTNKKPVGERLAMAAAGMVYSKTGEGSSPLYQSSTVEGAKMKITFDGVGAGLVAKDGVLKGFEIAGADHKFVPAEAAIEGKTVLVSSPQVSSPVEVRYGWEDNPTCTLYNQEGLPASPFRTGSTP